MFVPLYSFGPRAVNTRRQRPRPPFALALRCHGQACPAPSFGGCRRASLWNWARVQNLARSVALSPKLGERLRQSGRVQPQQPSTCTVCEVSRWLAGPHHLGESSQDARGTDTSAGQQSRAHIY
ncbi:hypothetical protein G5714_014689 [Onychostoma macrolepis]|uniref:Uncharacterized protein n=1 Tax=Onychostoma macrolepis TaxID=369639 RepID=A0A7J6CD12_9TELE|nr:hypothetical protein G5714_014689 [Onychostoma macrolepis]